MIFVRQLVELYKGIFISRLNEIDSHVESYREGSVHELFVTSKSQNMNNALQKELEENLGIKGIESLNIYRNYLVEGLTDDEFEKTRGRIFSEAPVDDTCNESTFKNENKGKEILIIESAPGQFDPRVDAVSKNIPLVTGKTDIKSRYKDVISFDGDISEKDMDKIKKYLINPNEKIESEVDEKEFERKIADPVNHVVMNGFTEIDSEEGFKSFLSDNGDIAIEVEDIELVKDYFKNVEKRDPTKVELLLIGTYWSDHCRHTTFETQIKGLEVSGLEGFVKDFNEFRTEYKEKNGEKGKEGDTFMQLATSSLRFLKDDPKFEGAELLDISEEDNAASFKMEIELEDGTKEDWVFMFKNETHNSPTNSEPFGGAATCLGGAIRDTASGRAFTFAAARITGAGDPTEPVSETMAGLVSQRALSIGAALGYASYGNQIGLAATQVREYFHPGYKAKRFEMGVVIAAVKEENLDRRTPTKDDLVIQFGGPVGRDGIGGATVSSKVSGSLDDKKMGAHVQKGNPIEERKFQRLLLNPEFTKLIKKSNDFGAGGVSVALGELSRGVEIDLDAISKHTKYDGLNDEELMISESQERMSIIIAPEDREKVLQMLNDENIVGFVAGKITDDKEQPENDRLRVLYQGKKVVDLSRDFLDTNGADREHNAVVKLEKVDFFDTLDENVNELVEKGDFMGAFKVQLGLLVNASQRGLQGGFDSSVGASTILAPYGGKYQTSPQTAMASKIPTFDGKDSKTAAITSHGFNPYLLSQNTYVGGMYSILETVSKVVATGGNHKQTWISLQEYFGKLTTDEKYGEVYAGLLGTLKVLVTLKIAAIGGKDSMSGSHKTPDGETMDVPPTIVGVANAPIDSDYIVSSEFKKAGSKVLCFPIKRGENGIPDLTDYSLKISVIEELTQGKSVLSSSVVGQGGIIHAISNLSLGNKIGFEFSSVSKNIFTPRLGDIIIEVDSETAEKYSDLIIGETTNEQAISLGTETIEIDEAQFIMDKTLESVWQTEKGKGTVEDISLYSNKFKHSINKILGPKPVALIPVFPGTNSELDTKHALIKAGFEVVEHVFNDTGTPEEQKQSRIEFAEKLKETNMFVVPGGFSWGDEPGASGIGAVNTFKSDEIRNSLQSFFDKEDTLSFGICNGAQILNKLGVIDNGQIKDVLEEDDTIIAHNDRLNHETGLVRNKVTSILSPFFSRKNLGEEFMINISHGEGNFKMTKEQFDKYVENGQIALQYLDEDGNPTNKYNGSYSGVAGMSSPDGRIAIMMPHAERTGLNVAKNVPGEKLLPVFKNAFDFFVKSDNDGMNDDTTSSNIA